MDTSEKQKHTVEKGYDAMAEQYLEWIHTHGAPRERYTQRVLDSSPASPHILEIGCGSGVPITRMLLDHDARVTANDLSGKQIDMAKERCPEATLILGDMMGLRFEPGSFDGAVSYYAIFHLPREEQKDMLCKMHSWLRPGSVFAFNLATMDQQEITGDFLGADMFWSSYGVEQSKKMIVDAGFELLESEVLEAGDGALEEGDQDYGISFWWVLAWKGSGG